MFILDWLHSPLLLELNGVSIAFRIVLALVIGGILGIERATRLRPAGFRTYMLVCLGATLVMMTNQFISDTYGMGDAARLGAQVISGIGFLGAGTIIVTRHNQIKGLTTAAGLWIAACLGLAIGIGFYMGAVIVGLVVLLVMTLFRKIDQHLEEYSRYIQLFVTFESQDAFQNFITYCNNHDLGIREIEISKSTIPHEKGVFIVMVLENKKRIRRSNIVRRLSGLEGVQGLEEI